DGVGEVVRAARRRADHVSDKRDASARVERDAGRRDVGLEPVRGQLVNHEARDRGAEVVRADAEGALERIVDGYQTDDPNRAAGSSDVRDLGAEVTGAAVDEDDLAGERPGR